MKKIVSFIFLFSCGFLFIPREKIGAVEKFENITYKFSGPDTQMGLPMHFMQSFNYNFSAGEEVTFKFNKPMPDASINTAVIAWDGYGRMIVINYSKGSNTFGVSLPDASENKLVSAIVEGNYLILKIEINSRFANALNNPLMSGISLHEMFVAIGITKEVDEPPTINVLAKSTIWQNKLSYAELLEGVTADDPEDGNLTDRIEIFEDFYSGNYNTLGEYPVDVFVTDNFGNTTYATLWVLVYESDYPLFMVDSNIFHKDTISSMSNETLRSILISMGKYADT